MAERRGDQAVIYYKAGNWDGTSVFTGVLAGVLSATPIIEDTEANFDTRDMPGVEAFKQGMRRWHLDCELVWDPTIASFQAVRDAYLNRTNIALGILDGLVSVSGSQGPGGTYVVTRFNRVEEHGEVMKAEVSFRVTRNATNPSAWITIP